MRNAFIALTIVALLHMTAGADEESANREPSAVQISQEIADKFEAAIQPCIDRAMATLPAIKRRFRTGLGNGESLYLTIRVADPNGQFEQVFVRILHWNGSAIAGHIASHCLNVQNYRLGSSITFSEGDVLDWTLVKADGSEEGNYIGRFLEHWDPYATEATDDKPEMETACDSECTHTADTL